MKKEAFLAIVIGIIVGLGITYGIYQIRQRFTPEPESIIDGLTTPAPESSPSGAEKLFITSPQNESVLYDSEITLSGTTLSQELVVIFVNEREYVTQADDIGAFAAKIQLDEGSNVIEVISIKNDGTEEKKDLVVILDPAASTTQEATEEAEPSDN